MEMNVRVGLDTAIVIKEALECLLFARRTEGKRLTAAGMNDEALEMARLVLSTERAMRELRLEVPRDLEVPDAG
jgi:hypothetical protein